MSCYSASASQAEPTINRFLCRDIKILYTHIHNAAEKKNEVKIKDEKKKEIATSERIAEIERDARALFYFSHNAFWMEVNGMRTE